MPYVIEIYYNESLRCFLPKLHEKLLDVLNNKKKQKLSKLRCFYENLEGNRISSYKKARKIFRCAFSIFYKFVLAGERYVSNP